MDLPDVAQRSDVLGQARSPVADAGPEEVPADALVEGHPVDHAVNVHADLLAQAGNLVDEGHARRQEGVRDVLDHLGGPQVGDHHVARKPRVQVRDRTGVLGVAGADHDAVGPEEVLDGAALLEELRVGHDSGRSVILLEERADDGLDGLARPDRGCALVDDDGVAAVEQRRDLAAGGAEVAHVGRAGERLGRVDGKEHELGAVEGPRVVGGEAQVARVQATADERGQAGLEDPHLACRQLLDQALADIEARDIVTQAGETGGHHQPHVPAAHDGDPGQRRSPPGLEHVQEPELV